MPDLYSQNLGNKLGLIISEAYVAKIERENADLRKLLEDPWYVAGDNETHCKFCFRTWRPAQFTEQERPDLYHDHECPCCPCPC